MTHKLTKTAILLIPLFIALVIASCKDDDEPVIFGDVISESGTVVEPSSSNDEEELIYGDSISESGDTVEVAPATVSLKF